MATNGRHSTSGAAAWNPAALLQPSRMNKTSAATSGASTPFRASTDVSPSNNPMVFQFASPSDTPSAGPSSNASTPGGGEFQGLNSIGHHIERIHNVQSRAQVPEPKRRRIDEDTQAQNGTQMPVRGGSGILGEYVKDKRKEANGATTPQSMTVDLTDGNDDDVMVPDDPKDEEVCYGMVKANLNCSKVPSPKPGTKSLWGDNFWPGIKIVLKRQVGDKTNRIQAYDHTRDIIGLLEPASSAALAPLLDSNIRMRTDCRIPAQQKKPGEEPGQETSRSYPVDICIYGRIRFSKNVGSYLLKHRLRLLAPQMVQKGIRVYNPHTPEFRPPQPRAYPTDGQASLVSSVSRTVEEIRSDVMGVFDSITRNEDLPLADPTSMITTPLLKHQRQGLFFMLAREEPQNLPADDKTMVSLWQTKKSVNHETTYFNVVTQETQKTPPPENRGGILADMMGLGKTLSILSLITSSLESAHVWAATQPMQPSAPSTKASRHDGLGLQPSLDLTPLVRNAKTTLLICPLSTVTNWEEQIKQHVQPGKLSYHIYHGSNRIKDPTKLSDFDIVITTYGSVSNELSSRNKGKNGLYPLEQIGWFRIVLDEAHMIREQATLQFKSIIRLQADRRWAVTGTPVQNRLEDLASLLAFLRLHPFDHRGKFTRYIVEPFKACDPEVVPKLRILVDAITLRRSKDKIDLPPREDLVVRLEFSPEERAVYNIFAKNAKDKAKLIAGSSNGHALGGSTYIHILKAILRLRLLCAHGKELLNDEDLEHLQGMSVETAIDIDDEDDEKPSLSEKKAHEMFTLMQETNNDACIECSKKLGSIEPTMESEGQQDDIIGFMTPCFHVICRSCIQVFRERISHLLESERPVISCPVCSSYVRFEFVALHRRDADAEHDGPARPRDRNMKKRPERYDGPHTKTKALLEDLLRSKAASEANPSEPPFKSVVFSGWTSHLDLIELGLNSVGITFTRLDGGMSRTARTAAMDSFREDDNVHVILVSIMAGGLGLNLTSGNNVYVMEPQFNPAAEAQAVDRVHRLGQKRPVRTVRYIMNDSFEEKMLELQDKKKQLASLSMDGQNKALDKAEAARQKLHDLRSLFK